MKISVEIHRVALLSTVFRIELDFRKYPEYPRKTLGPRMRNNNKINPDMTPGPGLIRTQAAMVGGECSHHCVIRAPLVNWNSSRWIMHNAQISIFVFIFLNRCGTRLS